MSSEIRRLLLLAISGLFIYLLFDLLILLFISYLLTVAFLPLVNYLKKKKIPRSMSSIIFILLLLALPAFLVVHIGPELINQGSQLINEAPVIMNDLESTIGISINDDTMNEAVSSFGSLGDIFFRFTTTTFSIIVSAVLILVITIYWLIYYDQTKKGLTSFLKDNTEGLDGVTLFNRLEKRMGEWVKGQLTLSLIVGALSYIAYVLIGIPFAGALAVLAGILEIIPGLGPTLAIIPALLLALTISPATFLWTVAAYLVIQGLESYLIAPRVLGRAVKLNPFAVLLSVIVGAKLLGLLGSFLAVPAVLIASEVFKYQQEITAKK